MQNRFDRVLLKNYTVLLSMPDKTRANYVSLENDRGDVHYTTLDTISDHQAFCLYSPKGNVTVSWCYCCKHMTLFTNLAHF